MICSKCQTDNPDTLQFCRRCHTPLWYVCPACRHRQTHGGQCDQCKVDFLKYAMMLQAQAKDQAEQERTRLRERSSLAKQVLLLPVTGGFSLLKYLRERLKGG